MNLELESKVSPDSKKVIDSEAVSKLAVQIDKTIKNSVSMHDAVDSLVTIIVPKDKYHFEWHVSQNEGELILRVNSVGRKNEAETSVSELI